LRKRGERGFLLFFIRRGNLFSGENFIDTGGFMSDGFSTVRGTVLATIGKAGTRKVVGYNSTTQEVLLRDEKRKDAPTFSRPIDKVYVDMEKLLSSTR